MAKKLVISFVGIVISILLVFFMFLKTHPPLQHGGISYQTNKPSTVCIDLENKGVVNIILKQVVVNNNHKPNRVLLGTSRSNGLISIGLVKHPPKGVQFNSIHTYPIAPLPKSEYKYMQFDKIRHYGIVVDHHSKIKNIVIKYSYLGLSFKKKIDVNFH